jgi:hypothetical protein
MTYEQLEVILGGSPSDMVKGFQVTSFDSLPKWSDLEKEYEPSKHAIWDLVQYPPKYDENGIDELKRTAFGLQKLAVNRIAQSMFSTPVKRSYNYDPDIELEAQAVAIIEELYRTRNNIDASNIERAKQLCASCQVATVWTVYERPQMIEGEQTKYKLNHTIYSEMEGYKLYPITDLNGEVLVLSIGYKDEDNKEHMTTYVRDYENKKAQMIQFDSSDAGWEINAERTNTNLEFFPVVYANIKQPVWGGEDGTRLVEQLEEMESYQGLYIKRNALPTFTLDYGELPNSSVKSETEESSSDSRRIVVVGKGGSMSDVTWEGAGESVTSRFERIRNAFFEQIQVPDTSFANMIKSNTSAENKELIFADAKAKAIDLGGEWQILFFEELEIVKKFVAILFPKLKSVLDNISIRSVIQAYNVKSRKETAEYVSTAGNAMSIKTKVAVLSEVDDIDQEVEQIQEENSANTNNLIL